MEIRFKSIGTAHTDTGTVPRHCTVSDVEGTIVLATEFTRGLSGINAGQRIVVLFYFHESTAFSSGLLIQTPPHIGKAFGVFSICSPRRPNPIGLSVLTGLARDQNVLHVKGMGMIDGTPILDIKPFIADAGHAPD
jgi:tRNA-Thr(GGU) m(6)t(6)A37 methyltransferase TsaA